MTPDDELRARLARLDPQATAPVDPVTGPRARHLLEQTMSTPKTTHRTFALVAAAAAAVAAVGGGVLLTRDDASTPVRDLPAKTVLALRDPGAGATMGSCIMLTPDVLRGQELAFAGHVDGIDAGTARLSVTTWFKGGTADEVTVSHADPSGAVTSESLTLEEGKDYLIATTGTDLSICSGSGEDTPELRRLFEQAFPNP